MNLNTHSAVKLQAVMFNVCKLLTRFGE